MTRNRFQRGQALSEAVVVLPVMVIFILAGATLYNLMSADVDANKAARLAAWHGVLHNVNANFSQQQMNETIEKNLATTVLSRDRADFLSGNDSPIVKRITPGDGALAIQQIAVGQAAGQTAADGIAQAAGLGDTNITGVAISIPVNADSRILSTARFAGGYNSYQEEQMSAPRDLVAGNQRFHVDAKAVLLTNGMIPSNEETFQSSVEMLAADGGSLRVFEPLAPLMSTLGLQEMRAAVGRDGRRTVADDQSRTLPAELGEFD